LADAANAAIPEDPPGPLPTGAPKVKLISYNLGLIQAVKYAEERLALLIPALKAADADVLCLQEVWREYTNRAELAAALADTYPYAWWSWSGATTWGGGILIVSKYPLYRGREHIYTNTPPAPLVDYMIAGASVLMPDATFHVLCTHMQAYADPEFVTIRQAQIAEIEAWASAEGYLDGPTFLLGDMNCGPGVGPPCPTCTAADVASYDILRATWPDPMFGWDKCTWCLDNATPLQLVPGDSDPNQRIDFCLARNLGAATHKGTKIVFDESVTYDVPGGTFTSTLSDHLGVHCEFSP
jgi:endonuclease/exonuclease/phosphatase family metal-dependent hydrolase